jgi:hypothetical protein
MLYNFFDDALHRTLTFSISSQSSMQRCKDVSPLLNREMHRENVLKFTDAAAQELTRCRVRGPMPRSTLPLGLADMLAFMNSCLHITVSEIVRESNRV